MWTNVPLSAIEEERWPAVPDLEAAHVLSLLQQFRHSERWPNDLIRRRQFEQLSKLVAHAHATCPFHRERLERSGYRPGHELDDEAWQRLPILTRAEVQDAGDALQSDDVPASHGPLVDLATSGSTGIPVRLRRTRLLDLTIQANHLRWMLWHGLDLQRKLCLIPAVHRHSEEEQAAARYPDGLVSDVWLQPTRHVFRTGPSALLDIQTAPEDQAAWLRRHGPAYLLTFPSNLFYLAAYCRAAAIEVPRLGAVFTTAEAVSSSLRTLCDEVFGAPIIDTYACTEAGPLAAQCREGEHYHVHAETIALEVVDDLGRPCRPGQTGRVVITPLLNFATVLLRYDLGDRAEVGHAECPLGLPVLNRIFGRKRQGLRLPNGQSLYPDLQGARYLDVVPVRRFQVVQTTLDDLEVRLEVDVRPTPEQEEQLRSVILGGLPRPFRITFTYPETLATGAGGKFEDFICRLEA